MKKKKDEITIRSSVAEYLTYVASVGNQHDSIEMCYENENIWTQKMMAALYNVDVRTINEHIKKIYSDAELEEFRAIIMEKLQLAERDYEKLKSSIMNTDGNDTDDTSPTYKVLEEGANTLSKEETTRLAARQLKFIQNLRAALVRIENKTYGICRETGKLIPAERLRAVPHATLSIEAKNSGKK